MSVQVYGDDWRGWLKALHEDIWEKRIDRHACHGRREWWDENRKLTHEEWEKIQDLIRAHGLVCVMQNTCFGFGCGVSVYEEHTPICVGVPPDPEFLVSLTQDHLPDDLFDRDKSRKFYQAWDLFCVFTHSEENKAKLEREGLPAPREQAYYDY